MLKKAERMPTACAGFAMRRSLVTTYSNFSGWLGVRAEWKPYGTKMG